MERAQSKYAGEIDLCDLSFHSVNSVIHFLLAVEITARLRDALHQRGACGLRRRSWLERLEEVDGEDADERLERMAEAGVDGDQVIRDGQQQEGPGEESGGRDAAAQREG